MFQSPPAGLRTSDKVFALSKSHDMNKLWSSLRSSVRNYGCDMVPFEEGSWPEALQTCVTCLRQYATDMQAEQSRQRVMVWKQPLRSSFDSGGRAAYSWLRDDRTPPIQALRTEKGDTVTQPADCVKETWDTLLRQSAVCEWKDFLAHFKNFLPCKPCEVPKVAIGDLMPRIQKLNSHRAVAICGWLVAEIKEPPEPIIELAALLCQDLEEGQPWPDNPLLWHCVLHCQVSA